MHGTYYNDSDYQNYLQVVQLYADSTASADFVAALQADLAADETYFYLADDAAQISSYLAGGVFMVNQPGVPTFIYEITQNDIEIQFAEEIVGVDWSSGFSGLVFVDDGRDNFGQYFKIANIHPDSDRVIVMLENKTMSWSGNYDMSRGDSGDEATWNNSDDYITFYFRFDNLAAAGTYSITVLIDNDPYHYATVRSRRFIVVDNYDNRKHTFVEPTSAPNGADTSFVFDGVALGLLDIHLPLTAVPGTIRVNLNGRELIRGVDYSDKADQSGIDLVEAPDEEDILRFHLTRGYSGTENNPIIGGREIIIRDLDGRIEFEQVFPGLP